VTVERDDDRRLRRRVAPWAGWSVTGFSVGALGTGALASLEVVGGLAGSTLHLGFALLLTAAGALFATTGD
jgi:hypothetical protein